MEETVKEAKLSIVCFIFHILIDILAIYVIIGIYWLIRDIISFFTTELIITNKRIKGKTGLINTNELDSQLNKIDGIQVQQNLFGKIFNYGTINIVTTSSVFHYKMINNPNEFKSILNNQIDCYDELSIQKNLHKWLRQ